jgi:hypothetical protein
MASFHLWLEVLSYIKALFEGITLGADVRKAYERHRQEKDTIAEAFLPRKCLDVSLRLLGWLRTRALVSRAKRHIVTKMTLSDVARGRRKTHGEQRFPVASDAAYSAPATQRCQGREGGVALFQPKTRAAGDNCTCFGGTRWGA